MLTRKQHELLMFIHERLKEAGVPPSFDEMKDALDLRSKSGIHRLIRALEERGFIRRLPNRARAIEVMRLPEIVDAAASSARRGFSPSVIEGSLGRVQALSADDADVDEPVMIPVMGRIAAGTPIEAIQNHSHSIGIPPDMLSPGEHFALEVRGDSMIEAGILDGDTVLIRRTDTADTGDIVVALVDEEEATLKRLRRKGASIALEAANPAYETRIFGPGPGAHPGQARRSDPALLSDRRHEGPPGRGYAASTPECRLAAPDRLAIERLGATLAQRTRRSMTVARLARSDRGAAKRLTTTAPSRQSSANAAGFRLTATGDVHLPSR